MHTSWKVLFCHYYGDYTLELREKCFHLCVYAKTKKGDANNKVSFTFKGRMSIWDAEKEEVVAVKRTWRPSAVRKIDQSNVIVLVVVNCRSVKNKVQDLCGLISSV